jgi:hypothetical protein
MNEREFKQNNSSDLFTFTRVIQSRKQARKTVGITISPHMLDEARNRNLNISRICEQALASIIDYIQTQDKPSFEILGKASFQEGFVEGRGRDLNPGARLHRPIGYQATSPRPL